MTTLIVATRNRHKVGEIQSMVSEAFRCVALDAFPEAPAVVEDGKTFAENAAKKALSLMQWLSGPTSLVGRQLVESFYVLADDSGLEVDALQGAPGVQSARFAAMDSGVTGNSSDAENNAKLLRLLKDVPLNKRSARFRCVLALAKERSVADAEPLIFEGSCEGHIAFAPSGGGGFGYDPLFIPDGHRESFAELGEAVKNRISHRARALERLREFLRQQNSPRL